MLRKVQRILQQLYIVYIMYTVGNIVYYLDIALFIGYFRCLTSMFDNLTAFHYYFIN